MKSHVQVLSGLRSFMCSPMPYGCHDLSRVETTWKLKTKDKRRVGKGSCCRAPLDEVPRKKRAPEGGTQCRTGVPHRPLTAPVTCRLNGQWELAPSIPGLHLHLQFLVPRKGTSTGIIIFEVHALGKNVMDLGLPQGWDEVIAHAYIALHTIEFRPRIHIHM